MFRRLLCRFGYHKYRYDKLCITKGYNYTVLMKCQYCEHILGDIDGIHEHQREMKRK